MPLLRSQKTVAPTMWRYSARNLRRLPQEARGQIQSQIKALAQDHNITRIIVPSNLATRIQSGKIDLTKISDTDWKACLTSRSLFAGNLLDLGLLHRVKRGPIQVLGSILGASLRLKLSLNAPKGKYDYAFMVHPRTYMDILGGVPFLKYLPENWTRAIVKRLPPFKLSNMTGLKDINGKPLTGALMCIGWDREMFEADQRGREEKIADLVRLAKLMGIEYTGFAALLPWASRYAQCLEGTIDKDEIERMFEGTSVVWDDIQDFFINPNERNLIPRPLDEIASQIETLIPEKALQKSFSSLINWANQVGVELKDMTITTGHPFTVSIIASFIRKLRELHPKKSPLIAIVGAAGSTGSCCCHKIAVDGADNFLLVDRIKSTGITSLDELSQQIMAINPEAKVASSTNLSDLITADIVIVVSSAPGTIVDSSFLKSGAIVVDDSQPRNVDPKIAQERKDIRIITVLAFLEGLIPNYYFDRHTPFTEACFTCAGDVSLRARTQTRINATGPAQMEGVQIVEQMVAQAQNSGLRPLAPIFYTYNRQTISYDDIKEIARLTLPN